MDKSALKKAYKQTDRPMGVYRIRSTQNKIVYIGYSTDIQAKINRHKAELKFGSHRNRELRKTWNSLGESDAILIAQLRYHY
ncbi:GIY-YIG nuclease family protein [Thermodesulfobacteriota bacterium]